MAVPLQCVDSTVAPPALLEAMRQAYTVEDSATCELLQRHLDATYLVSGKSDRLIARLYNARWWSQEEVEGEVAVLRHLTNRRVRVAAPVKRRDGGCMTTIHAPEGERQLVVYEYLDGDGLLPSRDAGAFGELVGQMHGALEDCRLEHHRRELTFRRLTTETFDTILAQLSEQNEHRTYLEELRIRVLARAQEVGLSAFREGLCHGDLNFSNAVRLADGQIGLYDFESCGAGILAYDLAVFRWVQRGVGAPEKIWQDFLDGYRRHNEIPERELAGMDLLVLLRQLYMLEHDARRTQIESLGGRWRRARHTPQVDALRRLDAQLFGTQVVRGW
jgi:Ser/Thr protein kinase RdoA (MazF antagonist)